MPLDKQGHQK